MKYFSGIFEVYQILNNFNFKFIISIYYIIIQTDLLFYYYYKIIFERILYYFVFHLKITYTNK
jgi:hypothetical protein